MTSGLRGDKFKIASMDNPDRVLTSGASGQPVWLMSDRSDVWLFRQDGANGVQICLVPDGPGEPPLGLTIQSGAAPDSLVILGKNPTRWKLEPLPGGAYIISLADGAAPGANLVLAQGGGGDVAVVQSRPAELQANVMWFINAPGGS